MSRRLHHLIGTAIFCCTTLLVAPARAQQEEFPVATRTLKNGMKVLVQTDHSIPNIALYIFYRIGSRNEGPGTTGISHFFEHMMFNGAKK
jgi:zinc protease